MNEAVILAAGEGTRVAGISNGLPKSLIPVCGKAVLRWQLDGLRGFGTTVICRSQDYRAVAGYCFDDAVVVEGDPQLGSAGNVARWINGSRRPALVLYCDVLTDFDWEGLGDAHARQASAHVTCLLYRVSDPWNRSAVVLDRDRLVSFTEKPPRGDGGPGLAWAGALIVDPPLMESFAVADFGRDCLPAWVEQGAACGVVLPEDRYLIDVGDPENYARANQEWRGR